MLNQQIWLNLPQEKRNELAKEFGLVIDCSRSVDNLPWGAKVTSDGYSSKELMKITLEKLQTYVGSTETDYYKLWDMAVCRGERPTITSYTEKVETNKEEVKYPLKNKKRKITK
jgi:hypothetical protein